MKSIVSTRGQTVIPVEVRKALGLEEGTKIEWVIKNGNAYVFPIPKDPVKALRGVLKGHGTYADWLHERNQERERERSLEAKEWGC